MCIVMYVYEGVAIPPLQSNTYDTRTMPTRPINMEGYISIYPFLHVGGQSVKICMGIICL